MAEGFDPDAFLNSKPTAPPPLEPEAPPPVPEPVAPAPTSSFSPDAFLAAKPQAPATPSSSAEMPGVLDAAMQGLGSAWSGLKQTATLGSTAPPTTHEAGPAAAPFELSDLTSPISRGAPKVAYRIAEGAPTLAAGVVGGVGGGALAGPPGVIAGGAAGSAIGAVAQSLGPVFAEELKRTPQDPDAAWDRSVKIGAANGLFSAAGWAAFPLRLAGGPLKQVMFQAFGVQPAISVANKATTNVITDQPITEGLGQAYTEGAVMSAVPAAGHALVNATLGKVVAPKTYSDPDMKAVADRIVDNPSHSKPWDFDDVYTKAKDDLHPLWAAEKAMTKAAGTGDLPIPESPYHLARLTRGSSGKASSWIDYETFDFGTGQKTGDSLRKVLNPVKAEIDEFNSYLVAKRAVELDARGIDTGVPITEAQRLVNNPNWQGRFEPVAQALYGYQDRLLNYLKDSGVINDEQVRAMQQANRDYVPFYRMMEEEKGGSGAGSGLGTWNPIKKIEGSERQIVNPIESVIKNTHLMIDIAERNRAMQAFGDLVARSPNGADIARPVTAVKKPIPLSQGEIQRIFNQANVPANYGPPATFSIFRPDTFRPGPNEISYFKDGKRHVLETDPIIANAVKGLDSRSMGALEKVLSYPAKLLRAGVTLAPEFFIRNMARDQLAAFAFSKNGYIPIYTFVKGMRSILGGRFDAWVDSRNGANAVTNAIAGVLGRGEDYKKWLKSGGANAELVSGDRNYLTNEIKKLAESGSFNEVKNVIKNPLNALQAISELMESATRVGEFANSQKRGKHLHESGFESREVTMDFWRIGAKTRALNSIVAFWNAQVEGLDRTARAFKERPMATTLKVGASVTLPSMLLWWANHDDKRMEEIPQWEKDFFWHIPTDKWTPVSEQEAKAAPPHLVRTIDGKNYRNDGVIYKVPKNFEVGLIFGSVPERLMDAYAKDNPDAWRNVGKSLAQAFIPPYMPQIALPALEQMTNYSFFTERPLQPKSMTDRGGILPSERFTPYTTETAKLIGAGLGKVTDKSIASPIIVENYVRQWGGTLGMQMMRMADGVLTKSGIVKTPPKPTDTAADTFFVRGFVSRYPSSGAESIQKFYETFNERQMAYNTARLMDKTGDSSGAENVRQRYATERGQKIYERISKQQKYVRDVYLDPKMSPEEKRRAIDDTYFSMIEDAREGIKLFRSTKR